MNQYFIKGTSSLLFVISTIKAIYSSKLFYWKLFNGFLIPVSFLCNATDYNSKYLLLDYATIFFINTSYINNYRINRLLYLMACYEYLFYNSIENSKNLSYLPLIIKAHINTYLYVDMMHFYTLLGSSITAIAIYKIRYNLCKMNNYKYNLLLTSLFHICITNTLYISSITA
jgi:hypothetical protein